MHFSLKLTAVALVAVSATLAHAQSAADAQAALKSLAALSKSKGPAKAAEEITAGTDPAKCKDLPGLNCFIANSDNTMVGNAKNPKAVGTVFPPDMVDVDGAPLVELVLAPLSKGKTSWEAKYKFALPGTKKIVPQHAFCEKLDAKFAGCVTILNAQ